MLRGLSTAGLGKIDSYRHLIELASQYGFQSVELNACSFIQQYGEEEAIQLLQVNNVVIGSLGLNVEWRKSEQQFLNDLEKLASEAAAAKKLGCTRCCTYVLPSTDEPSAQFMAAATYRLRLCAQILGAYGISLGLEFVGPHHLRSTWANPFIWTLQDTLQWIKTIGEPNVGLLLDAYHWYTTELTVADIEQLQAHQIVHVHINDARAVPVSEVLDNDRVYPGEGVIDLVGFLQALKKIGYSGSVTQEILTKTAPTETAEALAKRSQLLFDEVWKRANI